MAPADAAPYVLDSTSAGGAAIRGAAFRIAGYVVGVALSIGSAAVLFRHLGIVATGEYVTVLSLIGVAQALTELGITVLGVREMAVRDAAARADLIRSLLGLRIVSTALGVTGAAGFAAIAGFRPGLVAGTLLAGAGLMLQNLQGTLSISLTTELRLGWVTAIDLLRQVVTVALILAFVASGASLVALLAIPIPAGAVALAATTVLVRRTVPMRPAFVFWEWRRLLRDTLPFVAAAAAAALYFRIAMILVSTLAGERAAGYYGASFRILEVLVLIPGLAIAAVFPIFVRAAVSDPLRLRYGVQRTFETATVFGAWMAVCVAVGAPFAIAVVAGPEFDPAVDILRIQAVAIAATFVTQTFAFALLSLRRHRTLLLAICLSLVLVSVLTVALIPAHGGLGAATAVAVGEVALAVALGVAFARATPDGRLDLAVLPRALCATAVAVVGSVAVGGPTLAMLVVASVLYFGVIQVLGGIPRELSVELRGALARLSR